MRAAMRARPSSKDEKENEKQPVPPQTVDASIEDAVTTETTTVIAAEPQDAAAPPAAAVVAASGVKPISQRQPAEPLDEAQRRSMAAANLTKIADAMMAYKKAKGHYPPAALAASGFRTLSWRVELLPFLGHEDLFKKFDLKTPWNQSPNKELLDLIPEEYVSPERFDNKTNWMVPADSLFMFGENRYARDRHVEDGIENTIMLLEVNDELATPWTKPQDFSPKDILDMRPYLHGLRGDGTFAAWANGWPTVLSATLTANQLRDAMTHESGDGLIAGRIHRDVEVRLTATTLSDTSTVPDGVAENDVVGRNAAAGRPSPRNRRAPTERQNRPLPSEESLRTARTRIDEIYADQLAVVKARDVHPDRQRQHVSRLGGEMLRKSAELLQDDAGAYALQLTATENAIKAGDFDLMIRAVDEQIRTFDVRAYDRNLAALEAFGRANARDGIDRRSATALIGRLVPIVTDAIRRDDFEDAEKAVAIAVALTKSSSRTTPTSTLRSGLRRRGEDAGQILVRLRSLLSTTKKQFESVRQQLADYRRDPDNVDAANAVGRYLCFIKGDWQTGLPLLTEGGSSRLREVAERDSAGATDPTSQAALGDLWYELGQQAKEGPYRQGSHDRAMHWYAIAGETMADSLDRMHVRARLEDLQEQPAASPLAAVRSLSRGLRIDPEATLEQIALEGARRIGGNDDDD